MPRMPRAYAGYDQGMKSRDLRQKFLAYFRDRGHRVLPGSTLVPAKDPSLLFTNAGMVQFKEVFLGRERPPAPRVVTAQRCARAGGKHNDLDNVGYTARHHTFFEMLGNFSFGDYFKREAIRYAWEFLTVELRVPAEKLWVTVYEEDDEAARLWLDEIGADKSRFSRCGEKDNFWSMGETGPCGPCSEIFYDHGAEIPGAPPGAAEAEGKEGDRYVEIWNLVFMQHDRGADGQLRALPRPSVDTGMGLERIAAVTQGVHNNYDTDLFRGLIDAVQDLAGGEPEPVSCRALADHIRSCAFLVADGVLPSNEGRGYVLRRIIRRAARHGRKLGLGGDGPFFHRLLPPLRETMGAAYPELHAAAESVERVLRGEEERFAETLEQGLKHLQAVMDAPDGDLIPGEAVFKLYDTYGFPVDLTADIARERGLRLDLAGYEAAMAGQRRSSREAADFGSGALPGIGEATRDARSEFTGYDGGYEPRDTAATILALLREEAGAVAAATELKENEPGAIVLDTTPFYAESGGQVGDQGLILRSPPPAATKQRAGRRRAAAEHCGGEESAAEERRGGEESAADFAVRDTTKHGAAFIHSGILRRGRLRVGDTVMARIDAVRRLDIVRNHSATHLLHAALRTVLGAHVAQKGSLVAAERLRFDFSHPQPLQAAELGRIERLVNDKILANAETGIEIMPLEKALRSGALSLFGEKYDAEVRVLTIGGGFSVELCGGTHVRRAGDIGLFKIVGESGVAAGVRRLEAVTGRAALEWVEQSEARLQRLAAALKSDPERVEEKLRQVLERGRQAEKTLRQTRGELAARRGGELLRQAREINGVKVLAAALEGADPKSLRDTLDRLKSRAGEAVIVLAAVEDGKISLVAGVSKGGADKYPAGELVNFVAGQVGGKGGGRADMAQAGGNDPAALPGALDSVAEWVRERG